MGSNTEYYVNTYGVMIPFVLLGFGFLVVLVVLPMQFFFGENRVMQRIANRFGLTPNGKSWTAAGLVLKPEWTSLGNSRTLHIRYAVDLPKGARQLSLSREGYKSGLAAKGGSREMTTEDPDFDDYFWLEAADLTYLDDSRRAVLLDAFTRLPTDAYIERGRLKGRVTCERSPWGVRGVIRAVSDAQRLGDDLENPERCRHFRPKGWVAAKHSRDAAVRCWLVGLPLLAMTVLLQATLGFSSRERVFWVLSGVALSGLLFMVTGLAAYRRTIFTLKLARFTGVVASLTILSTAPYWLLAATMTGTVLVAGLAVATIVGLYMAYLSLTRLRLS